jgi:hypothetical protein
MGRMVARIKAVFDWAGTIYTLLGFFGGAAFVGGIATTIGAAVWAVITGVPTPIVIMAAFCTITASVCLSIAPLAYRALCRITALTPADPGSTIENKLDFEVWGHKEEFYLYEAACLFADASPSPFIKHGTNADAWWGALIAALNNNEIKRVESAKDNSVGYSYSLGKYDPHNYTTILKNELKKFADKRSQRPRFLFP